MAIADMYLMVTWLVLQQTETPSIAISKYDTCKRSQEAKGIVQTAYIYAIVGITAN